MTLAELIARRNDIEAANQAFLARSEAGETLSDDDQATLTANVTEFDTLTVDITQREKIAAQTATMVAPNGRQTAPTAAAPAATPIRNVQGTTASRAQNGMGGFDSFGGYAQAIIQAAVNPASTDSRLLAQQGNNTLTGPDGGYLIPPDFREMIMEKITTEQSLLGMTDGLQTSSNSIQIPKSSIEQWAAPGAGNGVQGYWTAEGAAITKSQATFGLTDIKLNKLAALVPVTEEQMEDGPLIDSYLRRKVPDKLDWMISDAIINGDGTGKPLGILDSTAVGTLALTRVGTILGEDIVYDDIVNMWGRLYAPWRGNSVWLINPALEEVLNRMEFPGDNSPVYMPAGGLSASPYATLMGRPVIPHQAMQASGSEGDIVLADLAQYLSVTKVNGIRSDVSMHIYFATDELAFRFIMRVGGEPWWDGVINANNGTYDQAAFVSLGAAA